MQFIISTAIYSLPSHPVMRADGLSPGHDDEVRIAPSVRGASALKSPPPFSLFEMGEVGGGLVGAQRLVPGA